MWINLGISALGIPHVAGGGIEAHRAEFLHIRVVKVFFLCL